MAKLLNCKVGIPMTAYRVFWKEVAKFAEEYSKLCGESGDVKDSDALRCGLKLHHDLLSLLHHFTKEMVMPECPDSEYDDLGHDLAKECCARLCARLDLLGASWLKRCAEGNVQDLLVQIPTVPPTQYLADAIATCKALEATPRMEWFHEIPSPGISGLSEVIGLYVLASSVDHTLMQTISQKTLNVCVEFQKKVDSLFQSYSKEFLGKVSQLQSFNSKYEQLANF